jgi:hypothetical protein
MADSKHLDILTRGAEPWKRWRREHPSQRPDLSGLELTGINLFGFDLSRARLNDVNLQRANLRQADLRGATLHGANLSEAQFVRARLIKADLRRADMIGAKLDRADLRRADLSQADLFGADLSQADLRGAYLESTNLAGAIISGVRLYGSVRDHWKIDGIICDHVFWDRQGLERMPSEGRFKEHQFESIWERMPTPDEHFRASLSSGDSDILILKRHQHDGRLKQTPTVFSDALLAYLNALADIQHLVNEYRGRHGHEVAIASISHQKHICVEITGATETLGLIRESIVPWRRRYTEEVEKINRAISKARITEREADILEIRSHSEKNPVETRMLEAEAAKKRTEAHLLRQRAQDTRHYIYKEIEADLAKLLPADTLSPNQWTRFKQKSSASITLLAESDLAD